MKNLSIPMALTVMVAGPVNAQIEMTIGDGLIDGSRIKPYALSWRQCVLQDGTWQDMGTVGEEVVVIASVIRHRQTGERPDGVRTQSDTYFDRATFAPLRIETQAIRDGERVVHAVRELTESGYTGEEGRGDDRRALSGAISSSMLHGAAMGLPLATMAPQEEPVTFLASMVAFDGTYEVTATWVGTESMFANGVEFDAWMIDVEWLHRESGDVYAPGPDGSGGRYWVVPKPPAGVPYVPRYRTETYAVEFVGGVCGTSG